VVPGSDANAVCVPQPEPWRGAGLV